MSERHARGAVLLVLLFGVGCPETYGVNGRVGRVVREDMFENAAAPAPPPTCDDGSPAEVDCEDPSDEETCKWVCL
jgi:hypothetical protein